MGHFKVNRILIVGCGYVGTSLGKALVADGAFVRGTTTSPDRVEEIAACGIEPVVLNVNNESAVCEAAVGCDGVVLCVGAGRSRPYDEVYLPAARSIVAAIRAGGVRRLIYTSSTGVYSQDGGEWVNEESVTQPKTDNGRVLVEAERILLDRDGYGESGHRTNVSVVRLGGIYGPGRELVNFVRRAVGTARSDGCGFVNLVHLEDICDVLTRLLMVDHHGVLNLTDDAPVTRQEFYDSLIAEHDLPAIGWLPAENDSLGKRVSNKRVKELLGYRLKHPRHC